MKQTTIGSYTISQLTLGTVALGIPYGVFEHQLQPSFKDALGLLDCAKGLGIHCFDTAREYGDAEMVLGRFQQEAASLSTVVSKFKLSKEALSDVQKAMQEARASIADSLQALQMQKLPICLFHMSSEFDVNQVKAIIPQVMKGLIAEGKIAYAGISVDHPLEIDCFLEETVFQVFQIPLNVLDQRLLQSPIWQKVIKTNKIVFARSVFLKGLLLQNIQQLTGNLKEAEPYLIQLETLAREADMSVKQFCISYIRDLKGVSSLIFGAETKKQVVENAELLSGPSIPVGLRKKAEEYFNQLPEYILTPRLWKI